MKGGRCFKWQDSSFLRVLKPCPGRFTGKWKVLIALTAKQETTVLLDWIAQRLPMGAGALDNEGWADSSSTSKRAGRYAAADF
jgi:hypothetical protein